MTKHELHHMTWVEVREAFKTSPVVLIPMGSMENQGPHAPTGDYLAAEAIAGRIARDAQAYCTPVIPFGYSELFRGFSGTITLSPSSFHALLHDVVRSLTEYGITKIICINGHTDNAPIIEQLARTLRRDKQVVLGCMDIWQLLTADFKKNLDGGSLREECWGHGADPVSSVMMHLYPQSMRMDLAKPPTLEGKWGAFALLSPTKVAVQDSAATIHFGISELTETGGLASPGLASAERGKKIFDRLVSYGVDFVHTLHHSELAVVSKI